MASAKVVVQNGTQSNNWLLDSIGLSDLARMNKRQVLYQFLNFLMIVSSALMIWKGLMVVTKSERYVWMCFCKFGAHSNWLLFQSLHTHAVQLWSFYPGRWSRRSIEVICSS